MGDQLEFGEARRIRWTPKEWQAVTATVILLSRKDTPRSSRYVTPRMVATMGSCSTDTARIALLKLRDAGVIRQVAVASGCHGAMYKVQW